MKLPGNPNYPPGVTSADIDPDDCTGENDCFCRKCPQEREREPDDLEEIQDAQIDTYLARHPLAEFRKDE